MSIVAKPSCAEKGKNHYFVCHVYKNVCVWCGEVEGSILDDDNKHTFEELKLENLNLGGTACSTDGCF